ncbi:MAG: hypothetical protein H7A42_02020 [Chlamydiales bacterium]|nr:hypothetical protein [Chlamydiales bacterium]
MGFSFLCSAYFYLKGHAKLVFDEAAGPLLDSAILSACSTVLSVTSFVENFFVDNIDLQAHFNTLFGWIPFEEA